MDYAPGFHAGLGSLFHHVSTFTQRPDAVACTSYTVKSDGNTHDFFFGEFFIMVYDTHATENGAGQGR